MRRFFALSLVAILSLTACAEQPTFYWHRKQMNPDMVPDAIKAQSILEDDLAECAIDTDAHNTLAENNSKVSTNEGAVLNDKGTAREDTELPSTYELKGCMEKRGWVRVKQYYTIPY